MKIILTGCTGFVGSKVLEKCLQSNVITSVVALSRKALPLTDPKLRTVIVQDFSAYSEEVLRELDGATSCIWSVSLILYTLRLLTWYVTLSYFRAMGLRPSLPIDQQRIVNIDYTLAGARACASKVPADAAQPFRFIYMSGSMASNDQDKTLWISPEVRRLRVSADRMILHCTDADTSVESVQGQVENELLTVAKENHNFDVTIFKTPLVLRSGNPMPDWSMKAIGMIRVDRLAAALITSATSPNPIENKLLMPADIERIASTAS